MENLLKKYNITNVLPINYGWSGDKKHILTDKCGTKYILRESRPEQKQKREIQYLYLREIGRLNLNMAKAIECGVLRNGNFYTLLTFVNGSSAENEILKFNDIEAYTIGIEAGKALAKIHSIKVNHPAVPLFERYAAKSEAKITAYECCEYKLENGDFILKYYKDNLHLMKDRPLVYTHGDYHLGNMVIENGKLGIIDFDKLSISDPYDDFKPYCWNALKSEYFATGLINGYFNNNIPSDFFEILKFYTVESLISHLPWAAKFGKEDIKNAYFVYDCTMNWYNNFNLTIPIWYKGIFK
jgi:aminoglycoside phosphotransferase (APT) family kinase protein